MAPARWSIAFSAHRLLTVRLARGAFLFFAFALFYEGFSSNRWQVADQAWFEGFERFSESMVVGRLVQTRQEGWLSYGGLLGWAYTTPLPESQVPDYQYQAYIDGWSPTNYGAYLSHPGGQAALLSALELTLAAPPIERLELFRNLGAGATALAAALIVLWFGLEFGPVVAAVVLISSVGSQWLVVFSRNLYWSLWSFYVPMIFMMYWLRSDPKGTTRPVVLGSMVTLVVLAKCLFSGFEYITSTLVMLFVPMVFYAGRERWGWRRTLGSLLAAAGGSIAAVGTIVLLLSLQIGSVAGSPSDGIRHLVEALLKRTYGDPEKLPEVYAESLRTPLLKVLLPYFGHRYVDLNRFFSSSDPLLVHYILKIRYGGLVGLFFIASIYAWLARPLEGRLPRAQSHRRALVLATAFSFLGPVSWFVLFRAHSAIHTHMNYIVWQMPFTFFGFGVVGLVAQDALRTFWAGLLRLISASRARAPL